MDILGEYERQHPTAPMRQTTFAPGSERGFFIRLVMKLSGDRIESERQAAALLAGFSLVALILSLGIFFYSGKSVAAPPSELVNKSLQDVVDKARQSK